MNRNKNNLESNNRLNIQNNLNYFQNTNAPNNDPNQFNHFIPQTTNNINNKNYQDNNFNNVYTPNKTILPKTDFTNYQQTLHDNLKDDLFAEEIVEYRINIDSADRDIEKYPDPFSFTVNFNANSNTTISTKKLVNGKFVYENEYFKGTPGPTINKIFKNAKYIKLTDIILPTFGNIIYDTSNKAYTHDIDNRLIDERFIILSISELDDNNRIYNTSDSTFNVNPFASIFLDKIIGRYFYSGEIINGLTIFNDGKLGNIKKLTIKFYDSRGNPLKMCNLDKKGCKLQDPHHKTHQIYLSFIIGVVGNDLGTLNKFEQ